MFYVNEVKFVKSLNQCSLIHPQETRNPVGKKFEIYIFSKTFISVLFALHDLSEI